MLIFTLYRTTFQKEPVLGSKKLDLYKIYQMVVTEGGCEKICAEKSWKKICEPFNFPQTCTNSAFVMKNIYIKFLEPYELEHYWGKKVPYGGIPGKQISSPQISQQLQQHQHYHHNENSHFTSHASPDPTNRNLMVVPYEITKNECKIKKKIIIFIYLKK
jgi:hypothetical protein